ncbi:MAG: tRNA (adenosine(37)-N6)-threonylcarbamoyltransferase complex dimerization subunit type 1 TsaB [Candidatus Omnitrophica bacterium]|nr:tRNA (adenosine(37)-N6)-threonylcarbamoyltransferase complex dimerization subunit type 1 TsaB [Candidatus Omnitrophota bacterium]
MKILGIDTTSKFLCLALYDNGKAYTCDLELGRRHSALLVPIIKSSIDALGWDIGDIDYFACGTGPGSFTGVRIGLAVIKGLAFGSKKPVIGIPSLDIMALNAAFIKTDKTIIPVIDAKRNLIYCGFYKIKDGSLRKIKPYMLLSPEDLLKKIKPQDVLFGDALIAHSEILTKRGKTANFLDKDHWSLQARNIIPLALERIRKKSFGDTFSVKPVYLYPKECQIKQKN